MLSLETNNVLVRSFCVSWLVAGRLNFMGKKKLLRERLILEQWLLTFLEVLNPTSSIHAFTKTFVFGKIKYAFFPSTSKHKHKNCTMHHLHRGSLLKEQNCRTLVTDSLYPWGSIKPRLRTTVLERVLILNRMLLEKLL